MALTPLTSIVVSAHYPGFPEVRFTVGEAHLGVAREGDETAQNHVVCKVKGAIVKALDDPRYRKIGDLPFFEWKKLLIQKVADPRPTKPKTVSKTSADQGALFPS